MSTSGEITNTNASTDFKRKRNFTEEEKNFLVELVQQHQQIITSKDNKSSMKILKDKVWSEIHQEFNRSINREINSSRTLDQLKVSIDLNFLIFNNHYYNKCTNNKCTNKNFLRFFSKEMLGKS